MRRRLEAMEARLDALARAEAEAAFAAAGLPVADDAAYAREVSGYAASAVGGRARQGGSTWQSVARGQGTVETDWLNGEIVRLGRLQGVPTPANALLQRETWRLLADGGEAGSVPAAALLARLG